MAKTSARYIGGPSKAARRNRTALPGSSAASGRRHGGTMARGRGGSRPAGMTVRQVMTEDVWCCTLDSSLMEVARLMVERDCGEIPVIDDRRRPVGVVTDRDIVCRLVARGRNPLEATVQDCMSCPVVTATPDMDIDECGKLMEEHRIRRIPVVDTEGACCGMVAQADLARKGPRETTIEVVEKLSEPRRTA